MRIAFQKRDPSLAGLAIRWWTRSPYSHCELLLPDNLMFSAHFADGGTRFVEAGNLDPDRWDILSIPTTAAEDASIRNFCHEELGCKYDWKGIWFSQVVRLQREHPERWFCSELCAAAVKRVGLLDDTRPCTLSPGKLFKRLRESGAGLCAQW